MMVFYLFIWMGQFYHKKIIREGAGNRGNNLLINFILY